MPLDPRIPLGVEPPRPFNGLEQLGQMREQQQRQQLIDQQIRSGQALEQERRQQTTAAERLAASTATIDGLMQKAMVPDPETGIFTFDRKIAEDGIVKSGQGHLLPTYMQHFDALDKSTREAADKTNGAIAKALMVVNAAGNTPGAAQGMVAYLKKNRLMNDAHTQAILTELAEDDSPEHVASIVTKYGDQIPQYRELLNAEEARKGAAAKQTAETAKLTAETGQIGLPKASENPTSYKEWQKYQQEGGKLGYNDYQTMDANRKRPVSVTNAATDDKMITDAANNILANPRDLTSIRTITSLRGDQRLKLFNEIKKKNPDFNVGNIDRQIKFLDSYEDPKGRAATNRGSMNNILQHAADLSDVNQAYRRTNLRIANTPIAVLSRQGGTDWQRFATPLAVLKDEIGLYFAGGYAPTKEQGATWDKIANDTATPAQVEQFAKDIIHVGLRRADTHNEQFKTVMGYDDPNLITPQAAQAGERLGLGDAVKKYGSGGQIGAKPKAGAPAKPTAAELIKKYGG